MHQNLRTSNRAQRRTIRDHVRETREIAGVEGPDMALRSTYASKNICGRYGTMLGLWRVHVMMSEVLQNIRSWLAQCVAKPFEPCIKWTEESGTKCNRYSPRLSLLKT